MHRKPLMSRTQNICLIILCVLFTLLAVIMAKELLDKRKNKEPEYNLVDITSEVVTNAMASWQFEFCDGMDTFIKKIYSGNFNAKDMMIAEKLYTILKMNPRVEKMSLDEINNKLKTIMSTDSLTSENISEIINKNILKNSFNLKYDNELLTIDSLSSSICNAKEKIVINIHKAEENGIYLNVYVNMSYGIEGTNDEENEVIDYYKDIEAKNLVERLTKNNKNIPTWDKYNTYKYKFLIEDNNYLLESISIEDN